MLTDLTFQIMTEVLRAVYGFENVRRAPRISGELKRSLTGCASIPVYRADEVSFQQVQGPFSTTAPLCVFGSTPTYLCMAYFIDYTGTAVIILRGPALLLIMSRQYDVTK